MKQILITICMALTVAAMTVAAKTKVVPSKTTYAADVLKPYVENGKKQLRLWVVQSYVIGDLPWDQPMNEAAYQFFHSAGKSGSGAYTGRTE